MSNVWRTLITKEKWKHGLVCILLLNFFEPRFFFQWIWRIMSPVTIVLLFRVLFYGLCSVDLVLSCVLWRTGFRNLEERRTSSSLKKSLAGIKGMSCFFLTTGNRTRRCGFNFQQETPLPFSDESKAWVWGCGISTADVFKNRLDQHLSNYLGQIDHGLGQQEGPCLAFLELSVT